MIPRIEWSWTYRFRHIRVCSQGLSACLSVCLVTNLNLTCNCLVYKRCPVNRNDTNGVKVLHIKLILIPLCVLLVNRFTYSANRCFWRTETEAAIQYSSTLRERVRVKSMRKESLGAFYSNSYMTCACHRACACHCACAWVRNTHHFTTTQCYLLPLLMHNLCTGYDIRGWLRNSGCRRWETQFSSDQPRISGLNVINFLFIHHLKSLHPLYFSPSHSCLTSHLLA